MSAVVRTQGSSQAAPLLTASLSLFAAVVHFWAMPPALAEWWGYGAFFLSIGLTQVALAPAVLVRPSPLVCQAGIWSNVLVLAIYVTSRTAGIPAGPLTGVIEEAGVLDMATAAAEVAIVFALVSLLSNRTRAITIDALLLLGCAGWAASLWVW